MRTYNWSRIPSDYIPFTEYDMPANAATSTDVQSDAFAEVVRVNLTAPNQQDAKKPKAFPQILNGGINTGYVYISHGVFTGKRLGGRDAIQDGHTWRLHCNDGQELPATPGVKDDRTYLADATFTSGSYWVNGII